MQKRQQISGGFAREPAAGDPSCTHRTSFEWQDKDLELFDPSSDRFQPDLELPIKIETRNFTHKRRERRQSDSISEDRQLDVPREEARPEQPDFEEMLPAQRPYDPIEELLLPLQQLEAQFTHISTEEPALADNPMDRQVTAETSKQGLNRGKEEWSDRRNVLLKVINNFKAYCQAVTVVVNFHQLLRKDKVTKMQRGIGELLSKENGKMHDALFQELKISSNNKVRIQEQLGKEKVDLLRTMPDELLVKQEHIE